jgi:hypothetical protein
LAFFEQRELHAFAEGAESFLHRRQFTGASPVCGGFDADAALSTDAHKHRAIAGFQHQVELTSADSMSVAEFADGVSALRAGGRCPWELFVHDKHSFRPEWCIGTPSVIEWQYPSNSECGMTYTYTRPTPSLKLLLPEIATILGESDSALYERQRLLVAEGLLHSVQGRGRGSGVRASPAALATLLIAMLATPTWSETVPATRALIRAWPWKDGKCSLTGGVTFQDGLTRVLADEALAERVLDISFATRLRQCWIHYDATEPSVHWMQHGKLKKSFFVAAIDKPGSLQRETSISSIPALTKLLGGAASP